MNLLEIINKGNKKMNPKALLTVYEDYVEIAEVKNDNIGSFSPVTKINLGKLFTLSESNKVLSSIHGEIPKNLLYVNFNLSETVIVYHERMSTRRLLLSDGFLENAAIPALLFVIKGNSLYLYAYKRYISNGTVLYKAPFSNMMGNNDVCFGNVKVNSSSNIINMIESFNYSFWASQFEMTKKEAVAKLDECFKKENIVMNYKKLINGLNA